MFLVDQAFVFWLRMTALEKRWSLRELSCHNAGVQVWHRGVITASPSGKRIAFASTLSVVILGLEKRTPSVENIIGEYTNPMLYQMVDSLQKLTTNN